MSVDSPRTRTVLPSSSSAFDLPSASTSGLSPPAVISSDNSTPSGNDVFLRRLRRSSFLTVKPPAGLVSDARLQSPLANTFTPTDLGSPPRSSNRVKRLSPTDSENVRMDGGSSSGGSGIPTPSSTSTSASLDGRYSTPPRNTPVESLDPPLRFTPRRLSLAAKPARILKLLAEERRPEESEVQSEAEFQRLLASVSELPLSLRTPRLPSDRGRYPEEAATDDFTREDTPSDDGYLDEPTPTLWNGLGSSTEPIGIGKASASWSDAENVLPLSTSPSGSGMMDVDMCSTSWSGSPSVSSPFPPAQWRHTPPPTVNAVRSNKRKLDDRFDPYPAVKRRAVSPSLSTLRDYGASGSPAGTSMILRSPMVATHGRHNSISLSISTSAMNSTTSSPTSALGFPTPLPIPVPGGHTRSASVRSVTSSPTQRPSSMLASPILRPIPRWPVSTKKSDEDERERALEGAGNGVGSLSIL